MSNRGVHQVNFIKLSFHISILCSVLFSLTFFISVINLALTDNKVAKLPLTNYYFAKIETGENDFDVFRTYMENKGWNLKDIEGNRHLFEKNGDQMEVINSQIKTLIIDGNINFRYLTRSS